MWITILAVLSLLGLVVPFIWHWRTISKGLDRLTAQQIASDVNTRGNSESALAEMMELYSKSPLPAARWAEKKAHEKLWEEAIRRGDIVRAKFPNHPAAYLTCVRSLIALGELERAESLTRDTARRFPKNMNIAIEYANIAHIRRDWAEAHARWAEVRRRSPELAKGYVWEAIALMHLGDLIQADNVLQAGMDIVAVDHWNELLIPYADNAHRRRAWAEAARRWKLVRELLDDNPAGYWRASEALRHQGLIDEASTVLAHGIAMFPTNADIVREQLMSVKPVDANSYEGI